MPSSSRCPVRIARLAYLLSGAAAVSVLFTDLFIAGNFPVAWGYYPRYGPVGLLFIAYFALVMGGVLYLYTREIGRSIDRLQIKRLRISRLALVIGCIGGVDFLPAVGIQVYAFGYIPIFLFAVLTGYAVVKFQLVDITPAVAASAILENMQNGVIVVDSAGVIRLVNPAVESILDLTVAQAINRRLGDLLPTLPEQLSPAKEVEWDWISPAGESRTVTLSSKELVHPSGRVLGDIILAQDITVRKQAEEALERLALHDVLTGLPNRALFFDRLNSAISRAEREEHVVAVFFIDLDGFKGINDRHGHETGDGVLRAAASRMVAAVRSSDTVARIGGDEFVIICSDITVPKDIIRISGKITAAITRPIPLAAHTVRVGATIGAACYPWDAKDPEGLLAAADKVMYANKPDRSV